MSFDELLPPGVSAAFGLPTSTSPVSVPAAPRPKKKLRKKLQRVRKRQPSRSEELDVVARETGIHADLRGVVGFLTVDYDKDDRPYAATFDPFDERLKNAILPVTGWLQSAGRVHVTDDDGVRWRFDILGDPEEYAAEESEKD